MTEQRHEDFVNECLDFNPDDYRLYGLIGYKLKTKIEINYQYKNTGLKRGYVATYTLKKDGQLFLTKLSYPYGLDKNVLEKIEGKFWLDFRKKYFGEGFGVPFENGIIVLDRDKWEYDFERLIANDHMVIPDFEWPI